jgi:hypothetical protein
MEVLDIGNDPDSDIGAVRPGDWRMIDDGAIGKQVERVGLVHRSVCSMAYLFASPSCRVRPKSVPRQARSGVR